MYLKIGMYYNKMSNKYIFNCSMKDEDKLELLADISTFYSYKCGRKNIEGSILFPKNTTQKSIILLIPTIIMSPVKIIDIEFISKDYNRFGKLNKVRGKYKLNESYKNPRRFTKE